MDRRLRIAVLIDADNVTVDNVTQALTSLDALGDTAIRRAYGNWFDSRLKRWEPLLKSRTIRPIQQFGYTRGKNATDMALVIDAMTLLHADRPDAFAVVTSDADFTPLVMHLRERGLDVYGFGRADTPRPFAEACTAFEPFVTAKTGPAKQTPSTNGASAPDGVRETLRTAVGRAAGKDGWARIQGVRTQLGPRDAFNPSDYGHSTLTKLLKSTGDFELRGEGSPAVTVRLARAAGREDGAGRTSR